jgi:hypothetical protein
VRFFRGFRVRACEHFVRRTGCEESVGELAAIAMHPFDNQHRPRTRELERMVRALSHEFTRHSRSITDPEELRTEARRAVCLYFEAAGATSDAHYRAVWAQALEAIVRPGESFGIAFSSDSIEERQNNLEALAKSMVDAYFREYEGWNDDDFEIAENVKNWDTLTEEERNAHFDRFVLPELTGERGEEQSG